MKTKEIETIIEDLTEEQESTKERLKHIDVSARDQQITIGKMLVEKYVVPKLDELGKSRYDIDSDYMDKRISLPQEEFRKYANSSDIGPMPKRHQETINFIPKDVSKPEQFVIAKYLTDIGLITGGCGSDIGWFKAPSSCGGCVDGKTLFDKLDLWDFVEFMGDRQYGLKEDAADEAFKEVAKSYDLEYKLDDKDALTERIKLLKPEIERFTKKLDIYKQLEKFDLDPELIETKMPEVISYISSIGRQSNLRSIDVDLESKTFAMLTDYWYYSGSGGCEYGVNVEVVKEGGSEKDSFVYRDAYSPSKDNWSLDFKKIKLDKIDENDISIILESKDRTIERTYTVTPKERETLSEEDQAKFLETYKQQTDTILKFSKRENATMPGIAQFYPIPGDQYRDVPYRQPEVIDEFVDDMHGEAIAVVQVQIDHSVARGLQFAWEVYRITPEGRDMISRDCAYEQDLKDGKQIRMVAKDYI
ncbi:MAG: hypothetical protein ABIB43_01790 [archaeon]